MEYTKKDIYQLIQETVFDVTEVQIDSEAINLLDTRLRINPADFLYIFDILEEKLQVPAADILKSNDYNVMRVDYLISSLLELLEKQKNLSLVM